MSAPQLKAAYRANLAASESASRASYRAIMGEPRTLAECEAYENGAAYADARTSQFGLREAVRWHAEAVRSVLATETLPALYVSRREWAFAIGESDALLYRASGGDGFSAVRS